MMILKKCFLISVLLISISFTNHVWGRTLPMDTPESVGMSSDRLKRVDRVIDESIKNKEIPGAVLLVSHKGKIVYKKAYGYRMVTPRQEKMTVDTIFDMASITKPMATASGIMLLVEDGKIRLQDPVAKYLPGFEVKGKADVPVAYLLTHCSGLPAWDRYATKNLDRDGIIADICSKDTAYEPGTKFVYSDLGFVLLGEIITRVSGVPENEFVAKNLYSRLGMEHTGYLPPDSWKAQCAATEPRGGKMMQGEVHDPIAYALKGVAGHAGLFSTVDDMAVYFQMLLNGGVIDGVRIFSPLTIREMTKNQSPVAARDYGFGWVIGTSYAGQRGDIFPRGGFGHTGWTGTSVWVDPTSQTFIVLLTNRVHPDGKGDAGRVRALVSNIVASSIMDE